ncbi:MAG: hypothetical protein EOO38_02205 [Cytophagaceae bacterium]|nr:MAG: hypothetical protein EOO38_02205 [Cytophagaceae bacterium]
MDIDGKTFEFSRWGAEEQTDTLIDLTSVLGDAVGGLSSLYKNTDDPDAELGASAIGKLMASLTSGLSRDKALTKRLMIKLSSGDRITCDGAKVGTYNTFYATDLMLAFKVMRANLEVQFGSFFVAAGSFLGGPAKQVTQGIPQKQM